MEDVTDVAPCEPTVTRVFYKWANYGRGWRFWCFSLRNAILSYSKIHRRAGDGEDLIGDGGDCLIGNASELFSHFGVKLVGVSYLMISSFRGSKYDDRQFFIFSPTKALHLRTYSKKVHLAWIEVAKSYAFRGSW